jgi:hypothetical protein
MKPTWEQLSLFTDEELNISTDYKIIGLTGYAQSGKDTVANILVEKYGYKRIAFADKIRDFLYAMNPLVACSPSGYLQGLVDLVGWDKAKQEPQVRMLLQNVGVAAREVIAEDIWIISALANVGVDDKIVIADVRFENEAEILKSLGGQIWRVKRLGVEAVNRHISEIQMDGYKVDQIFINNGTIEDLENLIQTRMRNAIPE